MKKNFKKVSLLLMLAFATTVSLNSCGDKEAEEGEHTEEAAHEEGEHKCEHGDEEEMKCEMGEDGEMKCEGGDMTEEATVEEDTTATEEHKCEGGETMDEAAAE